MGAITSGVFNLPNNLSDQIVKTVTSGSAVAALGKSQPQRFGKTQLITFTGAPKAEYVEEGDKKSPSDATFGSVTATPHKAQVTVRFDQEVQWADEDAQIGALTTLADSGARALERALDLGVFYRLNPLTGNEITKWSNYLNSSTLRVTGTDDAAKDIETAVGKVLGAGDEGYDVNGIALTRSEAFALATAKDKQGRPLYPELGYGVTANAFKGIPLAVTSTVNPPEAVKRPGVRGIVGDFANGIYWGVQRNLPVELITTGDPDGQGDLKRFNQIALRLEIVYAWYVFADRFALIDEPAPASSTASTGTASAGPGK